MFPQLVVYFALAITNCLINRLADSILFSQAPQIARVLADTSAHGLTAGICYFLFDLFNRDHSYRLKLILSIACALASSSIDADHFIEARSTSLASATSLERRPFLHCSATAMVIVVISGSMEIVYYRLMRRRSEMTWILFWAFMTHHLRDGQRRGLWFRPPIGVDTRPVSEWMYFGVITILPAVMGWIWIGLGRYGRRSDAVLAV